MLNSFLPFPLSLLLHYISTSLPKMEVKCLFPRTRGLGTGVTCVGSFLIHMHTKTVPVLLFSSSYHLYFLKASSHSTFFCPVLLLLAPVLVLLSAPLVPLLDCKLPEPILFLSPDIQHFSTIEQALGCLFLVRGKAQQKSTCLTRVRPRIQSLYTDTQMNHTLFRP